MGYMLQFGEITHEDFIIIIQFNLKMVPLLHLN